MAVEILGMAEAGRGIGMTTREVVDNSGQRAS